MTYQDRKIARFINKRTINVWSSKYNCILKQLCDTHFQESINTAKTITNTFVQKNLILTRYYKINLSTQSYLMINHFLFVVIKKKNTADCICHLQIITPILLSIDVLFT